MRYEADERRIHARREETRGAAGVSVAPTSLARTMHTVPERPRPRAAGAILVGLLVSAATAATVLGFGHRAPRAYPAVMVTSTAMAAAGRYSVSTSHPMELEGAQPAATTTTDAGPGHEARESALSTLSTH